MSLFSNFPSYDIVIKGAARTFMRYPLALISAVFATIVTVMLVEQPQPENHQLLERLQLAGALGIALFIALVHLSEKMRWPKAAHSVVQLGGVVLLVAYYLTLPEDVYSAYIDIVRFLLLAIGLHFLVAVLPYVADKQVQGFWQYNKSLFLRFLTAALYSGVLYIGLTIALAAADHLFNMDVPPERYFQMWIITVGIFNTWVFLAGVPEDLHKLSDDYAYPKGLKIFTQYILLSLVALYFVILIAYEAKIIIEWNWPKGWVSHLVLWYSVVGILSALLLHPLKEQTGNRWIQAFTTWFYRLLIPLVVLLFLAIMRRISDYGITENRYFVLAMAIGLSVAMLYFIFGRGKDIRIIPGILCVLAFLSAFGPWSSFSVSKNNQMGRLETIMVRNNILVDGVIQKAPGQVPFEDRKQMSSIITYLNEWHDLKSLSGWLSDSTLASIDTVDRHRQDNEITRTMGFEWVASWKSLESGSWFSLYRKSTTVDLAGFAYLLELDVNGSTVQPAQFQVNDLPCLVTLDISQAIVKVRLGEDSASDDNLVELPLRPALANLINSFYPDQIPAELMTFTGECAAFEVRLIIDEVNGYDKIESLDIDRMKANLLLRLK